jgi:hypothetical protein
MANRQWEDQWFRECGRHEVAVPGAPDAWEACKGVHLTLYSQVLCSTP